MLGRYNEPHFTFPLSGTFQMEEAIYSKQEIGALLRYMC